MAQVLYTNKAQHDLPDGSHQNVHSFYTQKCNIETVLVRFVHNMLIIYTQENKKVNDILYQ